MRVLKRDNTYEAISFDKVLRRIRNLCASPALEGVDPDKIAQEVCSRIYDGVRTSELDELAAQMCASMVTTHPDYGVLAARIIVSNHHKNTSPSFSETISILYHAKDVHGEPNPLISEELWEIVQNHKEKLNSVIDYQRDYAFDFFGFKTLERSYLLRVDNKIVERPQHMILRVALGIHGWDLKEAIETYDLMSQRMFTHATPTLFNAGTPRSQLASCFLLGSEDSIGGIYKALSDCAHISKYSGGIGIHIHTIRSKGSHIRGTNGKSTGVIPMLRVFNDTARYVNQSGKRNGSIAVYLEPWHADVEAFLEIRKNQGAEEERCHDLFSAMWIPDLFMRRVQENGDWCLMCPDQCRGLSDLYGEEFDRLYEKYETEGKYVKKVKAQTIWLGILKSQVETGTPYLCYKDAANKKSNQKNIGTIKSSNLCVAPETLVLTEIGEVPIKSLANQNVKVWNGKDWSNVTVYQTSSNTPLIRVHIQRYKEEAVRTIDCTYYHKFFLKNGTLVRAADLKPGMSLMKYEIPDDEEIPAKPTDMTLCEYEPVVVQIEHTGRIDNTYCFNEPLRHAGIFNGVLTGQCSEIMEYSDPTSVAVCNLASICLPAFVKSDGTYDFERLHQISMTVTRNLNKVIDRTFYPIPETESNNLRHRPIGIGVQGLADAYAMMRLPFDSEEAAKLNREIFETIYHGAITASIAIAKRREELRDEYDASSTSAERRTEIQKYLRLTSEEAALTKYRGAYATFEGSPAADGKFQFDLWGATPEGRWEWETVREDMKRYGLRNSLLLAPMPTASTSQIMGNTECFEPITSTIFQRMTLAGEFTIINKHLVKDLLERGMWSVDIKNRILAGGGSIQHIAEIPEEIRALYKTVWELKQKVLIDQAADRGIYVCQSQSLNLFLEDPEFTKLSNMHFYAWRKGLKTGIYYLRTRPRAKISAFTLDATGPRQKVPEEPEPCLTCSA